MSRSSGLAIDGSAIVLESGVNGVPNVGCSGDRCVLVWSQIGTAPMKTTRTDPITGAVSDPGVVDFLPGFAADVSCAGGICLIALQASVARIDLATGVVLDPSHMRNVRCPARHGVAASGQTC